MSETFKIGDTFTMTVHLRGWRRLWAWVRGRPLIDMQTFKVTAAAGEEPTPHP